MTCPKHWGLPGVYLGKACPFCEPESEPRGDHNFKTSVKNIPAPCARVAQEPSKVKTYDQIRISVGGEELTGFVVSKHVDWQAYIYPIVASSTDALDAMDYLGWYMDWSKV